jgi:hypothetical protein
MEEAMAVLQRPGAGGSLFQKLESVIVKVGLSRSTQFGRWGGWGQHTAAAPNCTTQRKKKHKVLEEGRPDDDPADLLATALLVEQEAGLQYRHAAAAAAAPVRA